MKLHQEPSTVQIATLLTVIGAEARNVFSTFTVGDDNRDRRQPVFESFAAYYQPLKNVPLKDTSFTLECKKGENRMTIIGQPYDN